MSDELKPVRCGCGGEAVIVAEPRDGYTTYYCTCLECAINTDYQASEAEAVEAWNRAMGERTAKVKIHYQDESVKFGFCKCGQAVNSYSTYCPSCGCRLEWE